MINNLINVDYLMQLNPFSPAYQYGEDMLEHIEILILHPFVRKDRLVITIISETQCCLVSK